jgi:hypothetical protein
MSTAALLVLIAWLGVLTSCTFSPFGSRRMVERSLGELAVVKVPKRLDPRAPQVTEIGTSLTLARASNSFFDIGSHTPWHTMLVVTQVEPRLARRLGADVFQYLRDDAFRHVEGERWEDAEERGAWTLQLGQGTYRPNTSGEAAWLARAYDGARGLALTYRVRHAGATRAEIAALLDEVMSSYRLTAELDTHFASVARDLGAGVHIAFPIELTNPFSWEHDASGARWMVFRRPRIWAADTTMLEQTVAVASFFAAGRRDQERAAREILAREAAAGLDLARTQAAAAQASEVAGTIEVEHRFGDRTEPAWLVVAVDPAKGIGVAYRVWKRDADREAAVAVVERAMASYRFAGDEVAFFAPAERLP